MRVWQMQKDISRRVADKLSPATLILCRHYPVITLGRQAAAMSLKRSPEEITRRGIALVCVERGGDATYHGPGQLTVYPVIDLRQLKKDIHWFLRSLEDVVIGALSDFCLQAHRIKGLTGAWVKEGKIASIGIAVRQWVAYHGMSINIEKSDMPNFNLIFPCGMDVKVASIEGCLGRKINKHSFKGVLVNRFSKVFGFIPVKKEAKVSLPA